MRYGLLGPATTFTHQAQGTAPSHLSATLSPMRYGFLGPETTFTHQALLQALAEMPEAVDTTAAEMVPFASVGTAATALLAGQTDARMAPSETSVEGGGCGTRAVPPAPARAPAPADADEARGRAAVCSPLAAEHFGLTVLADGIEDYDGAITRFVLVTREGRIPARTGADKTTLVLQLPHNRSGALLEALEILASNGVNMSRIESRPVGDFLGRYSFSLDLEGHIEDRRVA